MRILIIHPSFYVYGGAELLIIRLCNYLTGKGVKNAVLTTSMLPEIRSDFIDTEVIVAENKTGNIIGEICALRKGFRAHKKDHDVINVHNFPAEISVFHSDKPVVWMCNEPGLHLQLKLPSSFIYKTFLKTLRPIEESIVKTHVSRIVVSDGFNAKRIEKIYGITPDIVHYGIDCEFFSGVAPGPSETAKKHFGLENGFVILHVGLLTPMKNQMESLKTLHKLVDKIPNIKLVFAGGGEAVYRETLEKYARENNLSDCVAFTGHIGRERLRDLFHASDLLLHPIKEQGGWLSPFEAMCAGVPVIVSEEMTASDIIKRKGLGIVTDNYADAILGIYKNPSKYRGLSIKSAEFITKNLSWEKFCETIYGFFRKTAAV